MSNQVTPDLDSFYDRGAPDAEAIRKHLRRQRRLISKMETRIDFLRETNAQLESRLRRSMQLEKRHYKQLRKQAKRVVSLREDCIELEALFAAERARNEQLQRDLQRLKAQHESALTQNQALLEDYRREVAGNERLGAELRQLQADVESASKKRDSLCKNLRRELVCSGLSVACLPCYSNSGLHFRKKQLEVCNTGTPFARALVSPPNLRAELSKAIRERRLWEQLARQSRELRASDQRRARQSFAKVLFFQGKLENAQGGIGRTDCRKLRVFIQESARAFN